MRNILILTLLILTIDSVFSQNEKIESVENLFNSYSEDTPGGVIGVVRNGEMIYQKEFGSANLDYSIPNNVHTKFMIGSVTKQFTGACIALLMTEEIDCCIYSAEL